MGKLGKELSIKLISQIWPPRLECQLRMRSRAQLVGQPWGQRPNWGHLWDRIESQLYDQICVQLWLRIESQLWDDLYDL